MNKPSRAALDAYYQDAETWAQDRQDLLRKSRRTAWIVAAVAAAVALLEAIALVVLMPLKTVEPYTLLVDRQTGFVQALRPLDPQRIAGDTALTQSFLVQYVIARESFDVDALQTQYQRVVLWSGERARADYIAAMQASNAASPLARLPRSSIIDVRVKSVSPIGRNVAMVRFETRRRDAAGQVHPIQAWAALVRYRYSGEPMRLEDRFVNPLGFEVLRYRRDPEALPPDLPAAGTPREAVRPGDAPAGPAQAPAPAPDLPVPPQQPEVEL